MTSRRGLIADCAVRLILGGFATVTVLLGIGVASGHRLVVLTSSSMAPVAPAGSLLVVYPIAAREVGPGDVLVMERVAAPAVTHRVVEVRQVGTRYVVVTQGDANSRVDLELYDLGDRNLVVRWIAPGAGELLIEHRQAVTVVGISAAAVAIVVVARLAIRRVLASSSISP